MSNTLANYKEAAPLLSLLLKGGWVMLPLLLLSCLALYAIIERLIALYSTAKAPQPWLEAIQAKILAGDIQGAKTLCARKKYAAASVIKAGIEQRNAPPRALEAALESAGQAAVYKLEKNLPLLGTIASTAPMLGFLGTVLGMIQAFMSIAQATHQVSPRLLAGGLYEAMLTTAAGLVVGITAHLGYHLLLTRIQRVAQRLEHISHQLIGFITALPKTEQPDKDHEA